MMGLINVCVKCLETVDVLERTWREDLKILKEKHGLWYGGSLRQEGRTKSGLSLHFAFGCRHPVTGFMQNIWGVLFSVILPTVAI